MKELQKYKRFILRNGSEVLVDEADAWLLEKWSWDTLKSGHVGRTMSSGKRYIKRIQLHREIMNPSAELVVDHINGNPLDNRRENLRVCTRQQNQRNMTMHRDNKSGYKGVCQNGRNWMAGIWDGKKRLHLGTFHTKVEAARKYDQKATELFGPYAKLNFKEN